MAQRFASAESTILSDEDPAYAAFSRLFSEHRTVNHSKGYSDRKGTSNNLAESFNARMRRLVEGIYLNPSGKYLHSYAAEGAWREDCRRLSTGQEAAALVELRAECRAFVLVARLHARPASRHRAAH